MSDLLRDSTLGQFLNYVSSGRVLPYADQRPTYVVPDRYLLRPTRATTPHRVSDASTPVRSTANTLVNAEGALKSEDIEKGDLDAEEKRENLAAQVDAGTLPANTPHDFVVTWEGDDDPDNPKNWSLKKRVFTSGLISLLTFSVYIGSAIYTSAIPSLMETFNTSQTVATLGLTLFVLAYGIGPMFLAPLQDTPSIGRNPVYIWGLFLFVLFQLPPLVGKNMATILVFRFFAGFVGSPALATGGASMGDLWSQTAMPYAIATWAIGAVCGPVLGPVIGGFAAQANGYRWPFYELLWISGFAFIVLSITLPETYEATILLKRAQRLRKLTGNPLLRSQSELDQAEGASVIGVAWHHFVMAIKLCAEPAVLFAHIYIGLAYAIFYLWFEAFPLVFNDIYHFNLGVSGLPFLGFVVSAAISFTFYVLYNKFVLEPRYAKDPSTFTPESKLEVSLIAGLCIPISLFIFGWTSRANVHWIWPLIGAALYLPGLFLLFQGILMFLAIGWYKHAVPIFAANDLFRSSFASFFPLFGHAYFTGLGLGGGSSLLAGIALLMIPILALLMKYGPRLRAKSQWAN